jgi:putative SOS response-associated peptidase YedK
MCGRYRLSRRKELLAEHFGTAANELLSDVHHRMPVILASEHYDLWADPTVRDAGHLLKPFDSQLMRKYAVSSRVNLAGNDGPECCVPFRLPAPAATLFD